MITFTPLSGAARSTRTVPLAYLLKVDDVQILLDCGSPDWCPENASSSAVKEEDLEEKTYHWEQYCQALKEHAPNIDLVLLSHGDLQHSGLYPYAYAHWGLKAPTYTTLPVQAMARIAATEDVEGLREEQDVGDDEPTNDNTEVVDGESKPSEVSATRPAKKKTGKYVATVQQVHDAFDSVNVLRYSQPCHLQGKCQGLTIIPFNAGHTLGGTIWKIRSPTAGTLLYAVDMNHMRERHLDGTVLMRQASGGSSGVFESLQRPDLLITDADRTNVTTATRKDRDAVLLDCITSALSSHNSVLMPCDASTRVLEILVLLDQHWSYSRLKYPICLLSRTGREMLTFVRSMMEWLGGTISKEDVGVDNDGKSGKKRRRDDDNEDEALGAFALRFKHLEFFSSPAALLESYSSKEAKLILAVPASLSHGPSRMIFSEFAETPDNVVLLTGRGEEGTLARNLFERWNNSQREETKWDKGKIGSNVMLDGSLLLQMNSKVPLQGEELEEYLRKEREEKEKQIAEKAAMERNQRLLEADEAEDEVTDDSDSDDDDDDEDEVERALDDDNKMDTSEEPGGPTDEPKSRRKKSKRDVDADWGGIDNDDSLPKQVISFDIYLKGNVSKAVSFFKTEGQTQRFRMFPYVEKKRRVDEYGETVDIGMWLRKGKALEEDTESEEMKELKRQKAEEDAKIAPQEPPSKFVTTEKDVQLACRLLFVDLEGLNNGRAVKSIVPQINPRKMIIVHASTPATDALIESCSGIRTMTKDIFSPPTNESIQIGQQTNAFSISLTDELLASVKMSRFEDNEVGFVTGRIANLASSTVPILEPASASSVVNTSGRKAIKGHVLCSRPPVTLPQSTMIGELKLTALKARLAKVGVQAELIGEGVLICGAAAKRGSSADSLEDSVSVKKTGRGRVELEGAVSDVYYIVRKEIYNLHALVAA
ncbi:beta-lactamase-like protein [Abortiporus biennis]|nr:beta-lactamase-like protein [Abortiporus biennis]